MWMVLQRGQPSQSWPQGCSKSYWKAQDPLPIPTSRFLGFKLCQIWTIYAKTLNNLEEVDWFLKTHSPPKLNQEEINNLNRPITRSEIESVIKKKKNKHLPANKSPGPDSFTGDPLHIREYLSFSSYFQKYCIGRNTSELILQGQRYTDTKTRQRYHQKRKLQTNLTDEHRCRNLNKTLLLLLLSRFSRVRLCATPWTAAYQASPSMGFSRQEHWSGLPFPSPMHESGKWKWSLSVMSNS